MIWVPSNAFNLIIMQVSLILLSIVSAAFAAPRPCPDPSVDAAKVELTKYEGQWFEIANSEFQRLTFQKDCKCTSPFYKFNQDSQNVTVINTCINQVTNIIDQRVGSALPVNPASGLGLLDVSFAPGPRTAVAANYVIVKLWGDYEQVLVGGSCKSFLWVLARTKSIPEERLTEILNYAASVGYDLPALKVQKTDQVNCPFV